MIVNITNLYEKLEKEMSDLVRCSPNHLSFPTSHKTNCFSNHFPIFNQKALRLSILELYQVQRIYSFVDHS